MCTYLKKKKMTINSHYWIRWNFIVIITYRNSNISMLFWGWGSNNLFDYVNFSLFMLLPYILSVQIILSSLFFLSCLPAIVLLYCLLNIPYSTAFKTFFRLLSPPPKKKIDKKYSQGLMCKVEICGILMFH